MKKIQYYIIVIVVAMIYSTEQSRGQSQDSVKMQQMYDYLDSLENYKCEVEWYWAIEPQFRSVGHFSEGLAAVTLDGKKWGYIDQSGKMIIEPKFDRACDFQSQTACVVVDKKYGIINTSGDYILEPQLYLIMADSQCGMRHIRHIDGKYGFVSSTGEIIKPQFEFAFEFQNEVAKVTIDSQYRFINTKGEILPVEFTTSTAAKEGLAPAKVGGKYGYINTNGRFVIEPQFDMAKAFCEGLAMVYCRKKQLWSCIDKAGNTVFTDNSKPPRGFDIQGAYFNNGVANVQFYSGNGGGNYALIDRTGNLIFDHSQDSRIEFHEGLACVEINDKYGFIDTLGRVVIEPQFQSPGEFKNGVVKFQDQSQLTGYIYIDRNGQRITDTRGYPLFVSAGMTISSLNPTSIPKSPDGYVDIIGRTAIKNQFNVAREFSEGLAAATSSDHQYKFGFIALRH